MGMDPRAFVESDQGGVAFYCHVLGAPRRVAPMGGR